MGDPVRVQTWWIGEPECPYRFRFQKGRHRDLVTLQITDRKTGKVILPGDGKLIGFLPSQQEVFREIFAKPADQK